MRPRTVTPSSHTHALTPTHSHPRTHASAHARARSLAPALTHARAPAPRSHALARARTCTRRFVTFNSIENRATYLSAPTFKSTRPAGAPGDQENEAKA